MVGVAVGMYVGVDVGVDVGLVVGIVVGVGVQREGSEAGGRGVCVATESRDAAAAATPDSRHMDENKAATTTVRNRAVTSMMLNVGQVEDGVAAWEEVPSGRSGRPCGGGSGPPGDSGSSREPGDSGNCDNPEDDGGRPEGCAEK